MSPLIFRSVITKCDSPGKEIWRGNPRLTSAGVVTYTKRKNSSFYQNMRAVRRAEFEKKVLADERKVYEGTPSEKTAVFAKIRVPFGAQSLRKKCWLTSAGVVTYTKRENSSFFRNMRAESYIFLPTNFPPISS